MEIFNIHSVAKHQKLRWTLWGFFRQNRFTKPETTVREHFSFARYCMLRGEKGKPFWFSSLGQMVQSDTIKIHSTL